MAYYDALITKWATLAPGTTQQKLAAINALTVAGPAQKALLDPSAVINAIVPADLASLTTAQVALLTLLLQGTLIDASAGTTIRAAALVIFTGKATTIANLAALVAPFDNPQIPWATAPIALSGGGLNGPVTVNELIGAGGLT